MTDEDQLKRAIQNYLEGAVIEQGLTLQEAIENMTDEMKKAIRKTLMDHVAALASKILKNSYDGGGVLRHGHHNKAQTAIIRFLRAPK